MRPRSTSPLGVLVTARPRTMRQSSFLARRRTPNGSPSHSERRPGDPPRWSPDSEHWSAHQSAMPSDSERRTEHLHLHAPGPRTPASEPLRDAVASRTAARPLAHCTVGPRTPATTSALPVVASRTTGASLYLAGRPTPNESPSNPERRIVDRSHEPSSSEHRPPDSRSGPFDSEHRPLDPRSAPSHSELRPPDPHSVSPHSERPPPDPHSCPPDAALRTPHISSDSPNPHRQPGSHP
jgi:hypothetical protein